MKREPQRQLSRGCALLVGLVILAALALVVLPGEPASPQPSSEGLAVTTWGRPTSPAILLIHGLLGSGRYWTPVAEGLAADSFVVAPDLLGFGRSPKPASGYDATTQARAVLAALDARDIAAPVWVGAHSLGAVVALRLAVIAPGRVRGIVAFGPPLFRDLNEARSRVAALDPVARLALRGSPMARWLCEVFHGHPRLARWLIGLLRPSLPAASREDAPLHTWVAVDRSVAEAILSADPATWLLDTHLPVRLVLGGADPIADPTWLEELAGGRRWIELVVVPGDDHHLPARDPTRAITEIRALMRNEG